MNPLIEKMLLTQGPLYRFAPGFLPEHLDPDGFSKSISWETGVYLKNFVEYHKPKIICELGTFKGYSTSWLIAGTLLAGSGYVHAYEVFPEGHYGQLWIDRFGLPRDHFQYHEIPGGIWNYLQSIPAQIDFVYHDTEHLPGPTGKEMVALMPRIPVGGHLIFDDMLHPLYIPMQNYLNLAFGELKDAGIWTWDVIKTGHGLGVARRIK